MGELHKYRATVNGNETVLKLSEDDARALYPDAQRIDAETSAAASDEPPVRKTRAASHKARTAAPGTTTGPDAPANK